MTESRRDDPARKPSRVGVLAPWRALCFLLPPGCAAAAPGNSPCPATTTTTTSAPTSAGDTKPLPPLDTTLIRTLAITRSFRLGAPIAATPTPDGKFVLFLRSGARDAK